MTDPDPLPEPPEPMEDAYRRLRRSMVRVFILLACAALLLALGHCARQ